MPVNSRSDLGSRNCCRTKARTCSFDRTSTRGGLMNFSPTAPSIFGIASASCLPYGPEYLAGFSAHAVAVLSNAPATAPRVRLLSVIPRSRSKSHRARVERQNRIAPKQGNHRRGRKKNAERNLWRLELLPISPRAHPGDGINDAEEQHGRDKRPEEDRQKSTRRSHCTAHDCH